MISIPLTAVFTKSRYNLLSFLADQRLFWSHHPALSFGIAALCGCALALNSSWILAFCSILFLAIFPWKKSLLLFAILLAYSLYTANLYQLPVLPEEGVKGQGFLQVDFLSQRRSHFGSHWIYKGSVIEFQDERGAPIGKRLPVVVSLLDQPDLIRPLADGHYLINGTLRPTKKGGYLLIPQKGEPLQKLSGSWSLAEWRFQAKSAINQWIVAHIPNSRAASFLGGISTGDFDDRLLSFELARFGVQHIMAISGFHFGLLAGLLGVFLRCFFNFKVVAIILLVLMSAYFLLIGAGPSVLRSWLTISIALCGILLEKKEQALNSLGIALLIVLLLDPLSCLSLGFQFSFLSTAAILLGYQSLDRLFQHIWPTRLLGTALEMPRWDQHNYCLLMLFRKSLALTLAVHVVAVPLTLFHFSKFPLMSLAYNLFFPFLVSVSLFLLVLAAFVSFVPPLAVLIHQLNSYLTTLTLNLTFHMPPSVDIAIYTRPFSADWVVLYTTLVMGALIIIHMRLKDPIHTELSF